MKSQDIDISNKSAEAQTQPAKAEPKTEPETEPKVEPKAHPPSKKETANSEKKTPANSRKGETDTCPRCGATGFQGACYTCSLGTAYRFAN
ncbi:hypothetical protein NHQ30_009127 [Ciborinia camelliae]|nr:hypothetical protein NHQ30_009127 [Ciborinia camelliae]